MASARNEVMRVLRSCEEGVLGCEELQREVSYRSWLHGEQQPCAALVTPPRGVEKERVKELKMGTGKPVGQHK